MLEDNEQGLSIGMSNDAPAFVNLSHGTSNAMLNLHSHRLHYLSFTPRPSSSSTDDEEEVGVIAGIPSSSELAAPSASRILFVLEQRGSSCATLEFCVGIQDSKIIAVGMDRSGVLQRRSWTMPCWIKKTWN